MNLKDIHLRTQERTLPIFILADVSRSMYGDKILSLNNCIREMIASISILEDKKVIYKVCIITFGKKVRIQQELTIVNDINIQDLVTDEETDADETTVMGDAFELVASMIDDRISIPPSSYRPAIVLISDGMPTDINVLKPNYYDFLHWDALEELSNPDRRISKTSRIAIRINKDINNEMLIAFENNLEFSEIHTSDNNETILLSRLYTVINRLEEEMKQMRSEMKDGFAKIEEGLTDIQKSLIDFKNVATDYQENINEKLQRCEDDEKAKEMAIHEYTDLVVRKLIKEVPVHNTDNDYKREEALLKISFGVSWNKLSEKSKSFLITSKVLYGQMITMESLLDYSGICILVTKALEEEVHKRFYRDFISYLQSKYPFPVNINEWHTCLYKDIRDKNKVILPTYDFTLGAVIYVCGKRPNGISDSQYMINKNRIFEYAKMKLFKPDMSDFEIKTHLDYVGKKVDEIRARYRNPSAHTNELKIYDAKRCFDELIDIEKVLILMLDKFVS